MNNIDSIVLEFLQKHDSFHKIILKKYPKIMGYLISYKLNPKCACKKKIARFVLENKEEFTKIITKFSEDEQISLSSYKPEKKVAPKQMAGEIIVIKNTPENYKNEINKSREEKWVFRGISCVESGTELKLYFY